MQQYERSVLTIQTEIILKHQTQLQQFLHNNIEGIIILKDETANRKTFAGLLHMANPRFQKLTGIDLIANPEKAVTEKIFVDKSDVNIS